MNAKKTLTVSLVALALAGCGEKDDGRLVARRDYDVPAAWALKTFGGRDFMPMFYPKDQSVHHPSFGRVDPSWDLDIFRESAIEFNSAWGRWLGTRFIRDHRTREIVSNGAYRAAHSLKDYMDDPTWRMIGEEGGFDRPSFLRELRQGKLLRKTICAVLPEEQEKTASDPLDSLRTARFYLPADRCVTAQKRFSRKGNGLGAILLAFALITVSAVLLYLLLLIS